MDSKKSKKGKNMSINIGSDVLEKAREQKLSFLESRKSEQNLDLGGFEGLRLVLADSPEALLAKEKSFVFEDLGDGVILTH